MTHKLFNVVVLFVFAAVLIFSAVSTTPSYAATTDETDTSVIADLDPGEAPTLMAADPSNACGQGTIWASAFHKYDLVSVQHYTFGTRLTYQEKWWIVFTWDHVGNVDCWIY